MFSSDPTCSRFTASRRIPLQPFDFFVAYTTPELSDTRLDALSPLIVRYARFATAQLGQLLAAIVRFLQVYSPDHRACRPGRARSASSHAK
jgi:hypothetical protein